MPTLVEKITAPDVHPQVIEGCLQLIESEVASKSGLSGAAVKAGYKVVKTLKPGMIQDAVTKLLPEFATALQPMYEKSGAPAAGEGSGESAAGESSGTGEASSGGETPTSGGGEENGEEESGGSTGVEGDPGPWDYGVFIPAEPQTEGDPALGYEALVTKGYITCGIPKVLFGLAKPFISPYADGEPLPGRPGDNADVPYNWNVHEVDGAKIASQNCLQCHAGHFNNKLVVGLGSAEVDFTTDLSQKIAAFPIPNIPIPGLEQMTRFMNRIKVLGPNTIMRTVGTNPAEAVAVTLVAHRDRHTLAWSDEALLPLPDVVVPSDPPPWWRAAKKNALFYNGMARGDHRGTMMLATALCTDSVEEAAQIDAYFHHIQAFIRSVKPPVLKNTETPLCSRLAIMRPAWSSK